MRVVKAAAVQLSPVLYSREGTVENIVRTIHQLGQQGVQFATFPETVIPYYPYFSFVQPPFQSAQGRCELRGTNWHCKAMRTTSMMDDCDASALKPLRKSSNGVQSPRLFFSHRCFVALFGVLPGSIAKLSFRYL
jgi:predicted amidohydrolase